MGSDDLFHRRKAKAADELKRSKASRSSYDKVLIVCEGEKTEPNYFSELVEHYKLNSANVEIDGSCGSSPSSVFKRACELYTEARKGDQYDRVYCVFDRDSHESYEETLRKISSYRPEGTFFAAVSIPCFEYWLILHFQYTTKPYKSTTTRSSGKEVLKDLEVLMPGYQKGAENIFSTLVPQLELAKNNSKRALQQAIDNHTDNPSSSIHELIDYLQNIQPSNQDN